jgi:hypothetical protein
MNDPRPQDDLREPLDLWRDDAQRAATHVDPDAIHRTVLSRIGLARTGLAHADLAHATASTDRVLRRYAVAAVVLIGLGAAGSGALAFLPAPATQPPALGWIEDERFALERESEMLSLPVVVQDR